MENQSIKNFPRYERYKDSGVDWIGEIPEHWSLIPNKRIFKESKKTVGKRSGEFTLLSLTLRGVIQRDMDNPEGKFPAEFDTYQVVDKDDFIFCHFDVEETPRTVGLSGHNGMITGAYTVYKVEKIYDRKYLYYFYLHADINKNFKFLYKGLRNTIPSNSFSVFKTPIAPLPEQIAIAQFLDHKTAQIDRAIAIKEKQIKLLNERKQIMIQEAVTKGLDPTVKMKDSGVEWIGEIPEHWEISKVKYTLRIPITDGPHETPELLDVGIPFISAEAVSKGNINFDKKRGYISEKDYLKFSRKYKPEINDVYLIKSGATTGVAAIVETDQVFTIWSPLAVFRASKKLEPYYLLNYIRSYSFQKAIELNWTYGTQQNIGMKTLGDLYIVYPSKNEQIKILSYLEYHNQDIVLCIDNYQNQIQALKEYKTTLINEAVTGKIKVN